MGFTFATPIPRLDVQQKALQIEVMNHHPVTNYLLVNSPSQWFSRQTLTD